MQLNRREGRHQLARIVFHVSAANYGSATVKVKKTKSPAANSGHYAIQNIDDDG